MDNLLISLSVIAMLATNGWALWLVRAQHGDMGRVAAYLARHLAQLAPPPPPAPEPTYLRQSATAPARDRFEPPTSTGEQPVIRPRRTTRPPAGEAPIGDGLTLEFPAVRGAS